MADQKEALINEFIEMSKDKKPEEMLPLMLAVVAKAKKMNITITKDEAFLMIDNLTKSAPEEKKQQMNKLVEILTQI